MLAPSRLSWLQIGLVGSEYYVSVLSWVYPPLPLSTAAVVILSYAMFIIVIALENLFYIITQIDKHWIFFPCYTSLVAPTLHGRKKKEEI